MTTEQQQPVEQQQPIDQQQQQQQQQQPIDQQQQQQQPMVPQQQQQQQQQQQMIPQQDQLDENLNIATVSDGGRELSKTILYVGNIHKSVAEEMLRDLFASLGSNVQSLKILHDKNKPGFNYSFVEYETNDAAEKALNTLNGTALANYPLKITWAFQTQQNKTSDAFNLFVGDLSLEIDDDSLSKYFNQFPSIIQANVMWDMKTGRSRGYGFVSFRDQQDAENALQTMNGEPLGGRPIRLNWASHKQQNFPNKNPRHHHNGMNNMNNNVMPVNGMDMGNGNRAPIMGPQSYEMVSRQTPNWLSVVYLGNLAHYTTQNDLIPLLQNFGYIVNFKLISEKGCAFVTYDSHERAALAIVQLSGFTINGRPLKCGWGKSNKVMNRNNIPVIRN